MKIEKSDVLIIGSGGAGLRAAIELHNNNIDVLVIGKCKRRDAHTIKATGGINAALGNLDPKDNWQMHAADTIQDGGFINDPKAVEILAKNAPKAIKELAKWGTKFHRENGKISQRFFGATRYRRACFIGDETGKAILNTLVDQALKRKIRFQSEIYIFSLLNNKGKVNGALGLDIKTGKIIIFHSKIVILATGGHSRMFKRSSSRWWENNGDGIYLAYNQGASFMDMELFQFHPTGMVWPKEVAGTLVTESVRGEGGRLYNVKKERFMEKYDKKRMELSARDIVSQSIYTEIKEGRATKHGGVYLDISHRSKKYILDRLPLMYRQLKKYNNIDISKEPMEIAPTAHYSMGGIKVNHQNGSTGIPNLFAIGEVTSGVHGGNRLGGNSLAEIVVFGKHTGNYIAKQISKVKENPINRKLVDKEISSLKFVKKGENPLKVKQDIQEMMWKSAGLVRNEKNLKKGLQELEKCKKMNLSVGKSMKKLISALDVRNMIPTCEMILRSAIYRKESRRAHLRSDYPKTLKKFEKNIICFPSNKRIALKTKKVSPVPKEIRKYFTKEEVNAIYQE